MPLGRNPLVLRASISHVLARFAWRGLGGATLVIPPCNSRGLVVRIGSVISCRRHSQNVGWEATAFQHAVRGAGPQSGEQFYTDAARSSDLSSKRSVPTHAPPVCVSPV
jgi:hypothetical protein